MNNEETIFQGSAPQKNESNNGTSGFKAAVAKSWKPVTIGGVTGILMGGGALLAASQLHAAENTSDQASSMHDAPEASVSDDMTFAEAFAAARAQVGPGGVFQWHGAVFNTYTAEEWQSMSEAEHEQFAQQVHTEVPVDHVNTQHIASSHHHTHVVDDHSHDTAQHDAADHQASHQEDGMAHSASDHVAETQEPGQGFETGVEGVRIVGYGEVEGHLAVAYDADGDYNPDIAIIDVDDSGGISRPDVIVTADGEMATVGEVYDAQQIEPGPSQQPESFASNPDVADDGMPDYMDDGMIDA
jgi:hypothetical protein